MKWIFKVLFFFGAMGIFWVLMSSLSFADIKDDMTVLKKRVDIYACQSDLDCVFVQTGCCEGREAIARHFQPRYDSIRDHWCRDTGCNDVEIDYGRVVPKCVQGMCQMVEVDFSSSINIDCENILRQDEKDYCWDDQARALDKLDFCGQIHNEYLARDCFWSFHRTRSDDAELCQAMAQFLGAIEADRCWESLAEETGDFINCQQMQATDLSSQQDRARCFSDTVPMVMDIDKCQSFAETEEWDFSGSGWFEKCVESVALNTRNADVCDQIPDQSDAYSFWFKCVIAVGSATRDTQVCYKISQRQPPSNYPSSAFSVSGCERRITTGSFGS